MSAGGRGKSSYHPIPPRPCALLWTLLLLHPFAPLFLHTSLGKGVSSAARFRSFFLVVLTRPTCTHTRFAPYCSFLSSVYHVLSLSLSQSSLLQEENPAARVKECIHAAQKMVGGQSAQQRSQHRPLLLLATMDPSVCQPVRMRIRPSSSASASHTDFPLLSRLVCRTAAQRPRRPPLVLPHPRPSPLLPPSTFPHPPVPLVRRTLALVSLSWVCEQCGGVCQYGGRPMGLGGVL